MQTQSFQAVRASMSDEQQSACDIGRACVRYELHRRSGEFWLSLPRTNVGVVARHERARLAARCRGWMVIFAMALGSWVLLIAGLRGLLRHL